MSIDQAIALYRAWLGLLPSAPWLSYETFVKSSELSEIYPIRLRGFIVGALQAYGREVHISTVGGLYIRPILRVTLPELLKRHGLLTTMVQLESKYHEFLLRIGFYVTQYYNSGLVGYELKELRL